MKIMYIKLKERNVQLTEHFVLIWYYLPHPYIILHGWMTKTFLQKRKRTLNTKPKPISQVELEFSRRIILLHFLLSCTFWLYIYVYYKYLILCILYLSNTFNLSFWILHNISCVTWSRRYLFVSVYYTLVFSFRLQRSWN